MAYFIADNIISSLGFNTRENFDALLNGRVGIRTIIDKSLYPDAFPASLIDRQTLETEFSKADEIKKINRLEKMMILSVKDALSKADIDPTSERTCFLISTTKGNIDLLDTNNEHTTAKDRILLSDLGNFLRTYFDNPNEAIVLSNACISGVLALNMATLLIDNNKYDHVIVSGGDLVSKFVVSGFMSFLSLSPGPCKPFDKNRDGLSLGEAAGTIILSKNKPEKNGIKHLGGASANDANHISGPSRTGEGSYIAIKKAMKEAGIEPNDIDHISAHGTATPFNDEMESISINRHNMTTAPVNSLKGYWGHTLGAAGIIETIIMMEEMKKSTLIKTAGFESLGVSQIINVIDKNEKKELTTCLKMASGFGGSNAAMIVQKQ